MEKNKFKKTNYMYVLVVFKKERHKRTHKPNKSRSLWAANLLYTQTSHTYTHSKWNTIIPGAGFLGCRTAQFISSRYIKKNTTQKANDIREFIYT